MTSNLLATQICPWLGSELDRTTRYGFPSPANRCFSPQAPKSLTTLYQEQRCLSVEYQRCPNFAEPPADGTPISSIENAPVVLAEGRRQGSGGWIVLALVATTLLVILLGLFVQFSGMSKASAVNGVPSPSAISPTNTLASVSLATRTIAATPSATPTETLASSSTPTPTPTPRSSSTNVIETVRSTQTSMPSPGTPTVEPYPYSAPRLLNPGADSTSIVGTQVELKWQSAGELRSDEWYDVQVWKDNETPHGIAWSKDSRWVMPADFPPGRYHWRIVVIQGKEGKWIADLSLASETRSLNRQ